MTTSSRPECPLFLKQGADECVFHAEDILARYEDMFAGLIELEGEGLPEDMPSGFHMRALFRSGAIQIKEVPKLGRVLVPVKGSLMSIYGTPLTAVPCRLTGLGAMTGEILEPSDKPVLWLPYCPSDVLWGYCQIMADTLNTLAQNINAMSQTVIIEGTQGGEINALELQNAVTKKILSIPVLDKTATRAQVLDLGAKDNTQNLIATFRALHAECLTILGIQGSGSEKSSGMTSEETTAVMQQVNLKTFDLLALFEQWCDRVNKEFNCSLRPVIGAGWTVSMADDPEEARQDDDNEKEEGNAADE